MNKRNKRFIAIESDYDEHSYRIGDTDKVKKKLSDFYNEEEEYYEYREFLMYLYKNTAFLSKEEVLDILHNLIKENEDLKLENCGLRYALENIKHINVEINVDD